VPRADAAAHVRRLERVRDVFGGSAAGEKLALLRALAHARLARARDVERLHEALLFVAACPDDARVHRVACRLLDRFANRADLGHHRAALADTGIAGTDITFRFFSPTAHWLARRWPGRLRVDWGAFENRERLEGLLPLLIAHAESPALDALDEPLVTWVRRFAGSRITDATWLVRRFDALAVDGFTRERLYDDLDVPIVLAAGPGTPSRGGDRWGPVAPAPQRTALDRARPQLARAVLEAPRAVRRLAPRDGGRMLDLARSAMVTRHRDLDAFAWGDPRDVELVDYGDGLQFAAIGIQPDRRLFFETVTGYLTLRNGIPIGYVLSSTLFGSAEIAYNVFETWRGAEAGRIFGRVLAMVRHRFGSDAFSIDPFQLGDANDEALDSGAWWFYRKMGFAPRAGAARRLMRREEERMRGRPSYRSSRATLARLAGHHVYWFTGRPRRDVLSILPLENASLAASRMLADRFGADREAGEAACAASVARACGVRSLRGWTAGERNAWRRWSPMLALIPGLARWSPAERRAVVEVVRAKGGRSEADFSRAFDRHARLRAAIARLAGARR
jgi:hypothetical protein